MLVTRVVSTFRRSNFFFSRKIRYHGRDGCRGPGGGYSLSIYYEAFAKEYRSRIVNGDDAYRRARGNRDKIYVSLTYGSRLAGQTSAGRGASGTYRVRSRYIPRSIYVYSQLSHGSQVRVKYSYGYARSRVRCRYYRGGYDGARRWFVFFRGCHVASATSRARAYSLDRSAGGGSYYRYGGSYDVFYSESAFQFYRVSGYEYDYRWRRRRSLRYQVGATFRLQRLVEAFRYMAFLRGGDSYGGANCGSGGSGRYVSISTYRARSRAR